MTLYQKKHPTGADLSTHEKLMREFESLVPRLNEALDRIAELEASSGISASLFNNASGSVFPAGTLFAYNAGDVALAIATAHATRAWGVSIDPVGANNALFKGAMVHPNVPVRTVGDGTITRDDPLWLSDDTAGCVQGDRPTTSGRFAQLIGYANGKERNGFVEARILIPPGDTVRQLAAAPGSGDPVLVSDATHADRIPKESIVGIDDSGNISTTGSLGILLPYVVGDILYASTTALLAKRAIGSAGDVLVVSGGLPAWASLATAGIVPTTRTITISGTSNQVISSAGAQDLSANRTWTLSTPQNIHTGATPTFTALTLSSGGAANSGFIFSTPSTSNLIGMSYTDSGSVVRPLLVTLSNLSIWMNRVANGSHEIRANTSTAGAGGEVTVARFEDDNIAFTPLTKFGSGTPDTVSGAGSVYLAGSLEVDLGANFQGAISGSRNNFFFFRSAAFDSSPGLGQTLYSYNDGTNNSSTWPAEIAGSIIGLTMMIVVDRVDTAGTITANVLVNGSTVFTVTTASISSTGNLFIHGVQGRSIDTFSDDDQIALNIVYGTFDGSVSACRGYVITIFDT